MKEQEENVSKEVSRLSDHEVQERVNKCAELRFRVDHPYSQSKWIEYCKQQYGDKSIPQYINYWMKAKEQYEDEWKQKLDTLLVPASNQLRDLLFDDNPKVRADAIKMIMKYSGNEIQKHLVHATVENIKVSFGGQE